MALFCHVRQRGGGDSGGSQQQRAGGVAATTTRYGAENARGARLNGHDDNEGGIAGSNIATTTDNDKDGT
jgi:hypothetical protein